MATGWTWEQAEALSYPNYLQLKRYWREVAPPACVTSAAFAGFKPKTPEPERRATTEEIFGALGLNPSGPVRQVKRETKVFKF
jgi:hypothetical protein